MLTVDSLDIQPANMGDIQNWKWFLRTGDLERRVKPVVHVEEITVTQLKWNESVF